MITRQQLQLALGIISGRLGLSDLGWQARVDLGLEIIETYTDDEIKRIAEEMLLQFLVVDERHFPLHPSFEQE